MSTTYVAGVNISAIEAKLNEIIDQLETLKATNPSVVVPKKSKLNDFKKGE